MPTLQILYASTSGHTEHVIETIAAALPSDIDVEIQRAEVAKPEDLLQGDVLLLASGTWNTGGVEGQMNPYMHRFLREHAAKIDLQGKKVLVVGLGDDRYRYTAHAADLLEEFVSTHGGSLLAPTLRVINEPYGQEEKVHVWVDAILPLLMV